MTDSTYRDQVEKILEPLKKGAGIAQRNEATESLTALIAEAQREARIDELEHLTMNRDQDAVWLINRLAELQTQGGK